MPEIIKSYPTWGRFLTACESMDPSLYTATGEDWALGVDSVGAAVSIARRGWKDGMKSVREIALPTSVPATGKLEESEDPTHVWTWDVTGADYDVGALQEGVPECWLSPPPPRERRTVRIMVNVVSSGGIPAEALVKRGAACVALVLALQAAGHPVQLWACAGVAVPPNGKSGWGTDGNTTVWQRWALTDDNGGALDTDRVLYALAHPACARQMAYCKAVEEVRGKGVECAIWLGWPEGDQFARPPRDWERDLDLYIPPPYYTDANWRSKEAIEKWVADQYQALSGGATF